jgi:hypothetical protein
LEKLPLISRHFNENYISDNLLYPDNPLTQIWQKETCLYSIQNIKNIMTLRDTVFLFMLVGHLLAWGIVSFTAVEG